MVFLRVKFDFQRISASQSLLCQNNNNKKIDIRRSAVVQYPKLDEKRLHLHTNSPIYLTLKAIHD